MKGSSNRSVRFASFAAAVALVLSLAGGTFACPRAVSKDIVETESQQARSRPWPRHFRLRVLWIL